jgi:DNA repair protein RadC
MQKVKMTTVEWKFRDLGIAYPELNRVRKTKITGPTEVYNNFKFLFHREVKEKFIVFWLNSANRVIGYEEVSVGNLNSSVVAPREVFRGAIVSSCANIIIAHNHPSGNTEPSNEDIQITKRLVEAGKVIDIKVFDHIIFTDEDFLSFVERRLI